MSSMILEPVAHVGLVADGRPATLEEAAELVPAARTWLVETAGMEPLEATAIGLVAAPGYWGGDAVGFVGEEYPGARPVTVVQLPERLVDGYPAGPSFVED